MWEVQGHGTVTGAGDPRDGAARREILPPWVDIRLTFADGARIDVLAVVRDGRIAIEDAQADPPLALEGFAALAEAIEAPLHNACQVVAGPHRPPAPQPVDSAVPADTPVTPLAPGSVEGTQPLPEGPVSLEETKPEADSPAAHGSGPAPPAAEGPAEQPNTVRSAEEPAPERAPDPVPAAPPEPEPAVAPADAQAAAQSAAPEAAREQDRSGRHRARPSLPRGSAARQGVAEIYRAAQQAGQDPVLAVMSATGFSRRKALRLIAGARDEGHLTPRHHRR
ncbi:DUF6214 family protein [Streptomyces scopuliridis]|uniref:DUF6214 family protein n=1 Tax=Streptomyces scopuliridis TaxID=452529 RepID=UPI0030934CE7|nr:DUF6214 family protein [Streptomyces scopuliridis]